MSIVIFYQFMCVVCSSFLLEFEGGTWDMIPIDPSHRPYFCSINRDTNYFWHSQCVLIETKCKVDIVVFSVAA